MGFSLGGNTSSSKGSMNQNIWDPQGQGLKQMYDAANQTYQQGLPYQGQGYNMAPGAQEQMNKVFNLGMGGMENQLGGGAWGDTSDIREKLLGGMGGRSNVGTMYESIVGGPGNTYIDPMVEAMKTGMMQNRDTMQSGNALEANAMGQGGSNRHAMQNAMLDKQINQDMTAAEMGMRGNAYDTDLNWKMDIARQADSNRQLEQDRMFDMIQGGNQSQQAGMNFGQQAQNLGMGQFAPWMMANQMPWMNMNSWANVMGDPTVLTEQQTKGKSSGFGFGF
jgi:hypothetical protein